MAASRSALKEKPEAVVVEMSEHMQMLADEGDWTEVENIAIRLRSAVMNVPESQRRQVMQTVQRATAEVASKAADAHKDVSGKLRALRRGQKATKAYELR